MASELRREQGTPPTGPVVGAATTGALVLSASVVWGALQTAAVLAFEVATTAGAAYVAVHVLRWRRGRARSAERRLDEAQIKTGIER